VKQWTTPGLGFLDSAIADARRQHLLRERCAAAETTEPSFCSNDYLGLATEPVPHSPAGAGASRLLGGDRAVHARLEAAAAELVGLPEALVFTSGYAANVGVLSALAGPGDLIVSDALNHASIIDGARLSRARVEVVPHLDLEAASRVLAARKEPRAFVVTESYFSMDADSPDLAALRRVCDRQQAALVVDEAHALGVLGPEGRGLCVAAGISPDVLWLWNRARSFVFSTAMPPSVATAALQGMALARAEPWRREAVLGGATMLRNGLSALGLSLLGRGPIIPWVVGEPQAALRMSDLLQERGLDVRAVRPPTVPPGTARLRLTVTAAHRPADLERALSIVEDALGGRRR
jgi:8-amino-7-oxononanoate synthase